MSRTAGRVRDAGGPAGAPATPAGPTSEAPAGAGWPAWARRLATAGLLFHAAAILAGVWAAPPASELEQRINHVFEPYDGAIRQGYSYRYYTEPAPTPVVTATIAFRDGRPEEVVRIPNRATRPRLLYQRELNLANWLMEDVNEARRFAGDGSKSRWAQAFAAHLGRTHPGCSTVTLRNQLHLVPPLDRVRADLLLPAAGAKPVDLDAEEFYTTPERIGEFPCDAS